jgi:hypothetical protein
MIGIHATWVSGLGTEIPGHCKGSGVSLLLFSFFLVDWVHAYDVSGMTFTILSIYIPMHYVKYRTSFVYHEYLFVSGSVAL